MATGTPVAAGSGNVQVITGATTLVGVAFRETAAAVATFALRDGTTTGDPIRFVGNLAASAFNYVALPAVPFTTGVFLNRQSGTTELVLYFT